MESPELGALQRRLRRLLTDPSGVEAALRAEGDLEGAGLAQLVRDDRGLSPVERLDVYANAYFVRIHDALREDFGALARALGPAAFHDLVKTYLMMHPPREPSLRHAGAHLAEHLRTAPFDAIFARRCPYAADLARLEWALAEAFFAEDAPALGADALAALPPEDFGALRFATAPSLRLLACAWPVHEVRERFDAEGDDTHWDEPPALVAAPTALRVWRRGERVRQRAIPALELEALAAAADGEPFEAVCERVAGAVGDDEEAAARAAGLLATWLAEGLIAGLR